MTYSPELLARGWLFVRGDDEEVVDERTGWDELPPTDIGSTTKSGSCSESDSYNQFTKSMKITQILLIHKQLLVQCPKILWNLQYLFPFLCSKVGILWSSLRVICLYFNNTLNMLSVLVTSKLYFELGNFYYSSNFNIWQV